MNEQTTIDFNRIRDAILFLDNNYTEHPSLNDIASHVNMSPFHFQRMFTSWAGVSPKQFLQYTTVTYAKQILKESRESLLATSENLGLSSPSRLHDLFVTVEAMTPGEYKDKGTNLRINYHFADTLFGKVIIASTSKGICCLQFVDNKDDGVAYLTDEYPNAIIENKEDSNQLKAIDLLSSRSNSIGDLKLHLKGTNFQMKVWEALLKIPLGNLLSYGEIAVKIGSPKASRAVGTAIGMNPIAYIIPCHRVIQSTGAFGGYHWGASRKKVIIGWECAFGE